MTSNLLSVLLRLRPAYLGAPTCATIVLLDATGLCNPTERSNVLKRLLMPPFLGVIVAAGVVEVVTPASGTTDASDAVAQPASARSLTANAVAAANAFKASLSPAQRATLQHPFGAPV